jgi:hypothetical protein
MNISLICHVYPPEHAAAECSAVVIKMRFMPEMMAEHERIVSNRETKTGTCQ